MEDAAVDEAHGRCRRSLKHLLPRLRVGATCLSGCLRAPLVPSGPSSLPRCGDHGKGGPSPRRKPWLCRCHQSVDRPSNHRRLLVQFPMPRKPLQSSGGGHRQRPTETALTLPRPDPLPRTLLRTHRSVRAESLTETPAVRKLPLLWKAGPCQLESTQTSFLQSKEHLHSLGSAPLRGPPPGDRPRLWVGRGPDTRTSFVHLTHTHPPHSAELKSPTSHQTLTLWVGLISPSI